MSTTYKLTHPLVKYCNIEQLTKHLDTIADMIEREDQKWESSFRRCEAEIINDFDFTDDMDIDLDLIFIDPPSIISAMHYLCLGISVLDPVIWLPTAQEIATETVRQIALSEFCEIYAY